MEFTFNLGTTFGSDSSNFCILDAKKGFRIGRGSKASLSDVVDQMGIASSKVTILPNRSILHIPTHCPKVERFVMFSESFLSFPPSDAHPIYAYRLRSSPP